MASSQLVFCFSVLDTKIQNKAEFVTSDDAMRTPMRKRRSKNDILKGFYSQLIGKVHEVHVGLIITQEVVCKLSIVSLIC